jgi:hypothetical protein
MPVHLFASADRDVITHDDDVEQLSKGAKAPAVSPLQQSGRRAAETVAYARRHRRLVAMFRM